MVAQPTYEVIGKIAPTQFDNNGKILKSPWTFRQRGESGLWISDLFPHLAGCADDLCVVRSMTSNFPEHTSANYFLHTGFGLQGRPSMGAWLGYGLGSENRNFPAYIVLNGGLIPPGGLDNFQSGFLPASYQASVFEPADPPVANIKRLEPTAEAQMKKIDFVRFLDAEARKRFEGNDRFESAVTNYEIAGRMQMAAPRVMDVTQESAATRRLYGVDSENKKTAIYARQCLIARRMIERGVREPATRRIGHERSESRCA